MKKRKIICFFTILLIIAGMLTGCLTNNKDDLKSSIKSINGSPNSSMPALKSIPITPSCTPAITPTITPTSVPTATPIPAIDFANGSFPIDSREISVRLEKGECRLLDSFPSLTACHLEGSTCYGEIREFIASHPNVAVTYNVRVCGSDWSDTTDFIQVNGSTLEVNTISDAFAYLPALTQIDLNGNALSVAACEELAGFLGEKVVNYSIIVGAYEIDSKVTNLSLIEYPTMTADNLISALPFLSSLSYLDASKSSSITLADIGNIQQSKKSLIIDYPVKLFGKTISTADRYIDLSNKKLKIKQLDDLRAIMPYMTNCEKVIMEGCGIPDETMDELRTELAPYTEVVWRVKCGPYSCRTDAIMIKFSGKSTVLTDSKVKGLYYCHNIRFLDLGHNHLRHIDFVAEMPDLEVCIIAVNYLIDITPIQNCTKLEYCEFLSNVSIDVTPLAACKELKHLNISFAEVKDITPLYGLNKLERLWISRNPIPVEQIEKVKVLLPSTEINTTSHNCTGEGWRENPRYDLLKEQFRYENSRVRSYYIMDGEIVEDSTR